MAFLGANTDQNEVAWDGDDTFTSQHLSVFTHDKFVGSIYSDQGGTLYIEQSGDAENWSTEAVINYTASNNTNDGIDVTSDTPLGFSEEIILPYVRLRFTHNGTEPTTFKLFGRTADSGVKY